MRFSIFVFLLLIAIISACKKPTEPIPIESNSSICFTTMHHTWAVPDLRVYIYYDSHEFPGWDGDDYHDSTVCDHLAQACFDHLPIGNHILMAKGYDSLSHYYVLGATQITVQSLDEQLTDTLLVCE